MSPYLLKEAQSENVPRILEIMDQAKALMQQEGRHQWDHTYPTEEHINNDIEHGYGYVLCEEDHIVAYAAVVFDGEPTYRTIDGHWLSDDPYVVVHRLAVAQERRRHGVAKAFMQHVEALSIAKGVSSFKVDTNHDNTYMQKVFETCGFTYCGIITLQRGGQRMAYEKRLGDATEKQPTADNQAPAAAFVDTKPHYDILDGLRGVTALMVVCFHVFEAFATSHLDQRINHGYLAVDFFFILSGFVVGYAYDDRWKKMKIKDFIKRRFIRLHPMVVMGALIGAALFYVQRCDVWDVTKVTGWALLGATLLNACLIPATPGIEVRGLGEMFPLNGPSWSLFLEYIGNLLYAFFIRKLPTKALTVLVFLAGAGLAAFAIWGPLGDICVGFALTQENIVGGLLRLLFSFSAGLLLSRVFKPFKVRGAFWIGALAIVGVAAIPRLGGAEHLWMNGLYDSLCALVLFPILVLIGASGKTTDKFTTKICTFLGDISYPLYMVHYPLIYWYYAWVKNGNLTFGQSLPGAIALLVASILLAYGCLKLYDIPVRKFLTKHLVKKQ